MSMSKIQIATLVAAAVPLVKQDDLDRYLTLPNREEILEILKEEQALARKAHVKDTALSIIALMKRVDDFKAERVENIRCYRRHIKSQQEVLEKLDRVLAYGAETGNYLPLVALVEGVHAIPVDNRELAYVPENWKPTKQEAAA